MRCLYCQHENTKVTDKRNAKDSTRRRRECLKCGKRFTTYEKSEPLERYVVKKDGRRERFDRDKIFLGIIKSCEKRNISHEQVDQIVQEIENKILTYKKEIPTEKIGEQIMKKLKRIDKIAYIRFASVYRDFHDVEDFKKEMSEL